MNPNREHQPVLLEAFLSAVQPQRDERWVDGTFGRGGHTRALLEAGVRVVALDQDEEAEKASELMKGSWGDRLQFFRENFRSLDEVCERVGWSEVDGILLDLGVSSPQFDQAHRGFSFRLEGPLDMRMDARRSLTAAQIIAEASGEELSRLFWELGEERDSRRIAKAIVRAREKVALQTTQQLADLVAETIPWRKGKGTHPATKVFQALRLRVNEELEVLEEVLPKGSHLLAKGGRFAVISFHSGEDRRVKRFFQGHAAEEIENPKNGWREPNPERWFEKVKRYLPTDQEQEENPRSRSARLRVAWKLKNNSEK